MSSLRGVCRRHTPVEPFNAVYTTLDKIGGHFVSQYHRPIDNWDKTQRALASATRESRWLACDRCAAPV